MTSPRTNEGVSEQASADGSHAQIRSADADEVQSTTFNDHPAFQATHLSTSTKTRKGEDSNHEIADLMHDPEQQTGIDTMKQPTEPEKSEPQMAPELMDEKEGMAGQEEMADGEACLAEEAEDASEDFDGPVESIEGGKEGTVVTQDADPVPSEGHQGTQRTAATVAMVVVFAIFMFTVGMLVAYTTMTCLCPVTPCPPAIQCAPTAKCPAPKPCRCPDLGGHVSQIGNAVWKKYFGRLR